MLFLLMKGEYDRIVAEGLAGLESSISGFKERHKHSGDHVCSGIAADTATIAGVFL